MKETIANINKTKLILWADKHNWQTISQTHQKKKKGKKTQINKIRNKKVEVKTDNAETQRIITDFYKQLYANKMDNLEEMDKL